METGYIERGAAMPESSHGRGLGSVVAATVAPVAAQVADYPHAPSGVAEASAILDIDRLRELARALVAPLSHRIRRGEGGLLVVNASLALAYYPLRDGLGRTAISLLCLLALYLFNDLVDARDDQHNPKKNRALAEWYARDRSLFLALWVLMSAAAVAAGAWLEPRVAFWVAAVSLINVAYSLRCKKIPVVDIVSVGLWGAAYASIAIGVTAWVVLVGAMTAVCHIYQTSEDRGVDAASGFATSAALRASLLTAFQGGLDAILVVTAWRLSGGVVALSLAALFAYWVVWRDRPRIAWLLAKSHFALVWAYLLVRG